MTRMTWNGVTPKLEVDVKTNNPTAEVMAVISFESANNPPWRVAVLLRKVQPQWLIDEIPEIFPINPLTPDGPGGP